MLEVSKPAVVIGDLTASLVKVESGVVIQGKIISKPEERQEPVDESATFVGTLSDE